MAVRWTRTMVMRNEESVQAEEKKNSQDAKCSSRAWRWGFRSPYRPGAYVRSGNSGGVGLTIH
jgi:hypothetical protein